MFVDFTNSLTRSTLSSKCCGIDFLNSGICKANQRNVRRQSKSRAFLLSDQHQYRNLQIRNSNDELEHPWTVLIQNKQNSPHCTGVLVHESYILTTGSCLDGKSLEYD